MVTPVKPPPAPAGARRRISEPTTIVLALGAAAILVMCVIGIIETGDIWLAVVSILALALIGLAMVANLRGVISDTGDTTEAAPPAPGRSVVMCTAPLSVEQVLSALGTVGAEHDSVLFVAPEGLGSRGLMVDERDYDRARRAETATVAALRKAGINAAGHVGDRNPAHAIHDALDLFPAANVVVVAQAAEIDVYREHVDRDELRRRTGADVRVLEAAAI
jgi:hypothetical protein